MAAVEQELIFHPWLVELLSSLPEDSMNALSLLATREKLLEEESIGYHCVYESNVWPRRLQIVRSQKSFREIICNLLPLFLRHLLLGTCQNMIRGWLHAWTYQCSNSIFYLGILSAWAGEEHVLEELSSLTPSLKFECLCTPFILSKLWILLVPMTCLENV